MAACRYTVPSQREVDLMKLRVVGKNDENQNVFFWSNGRKTMKVGILTFPNSTSYGATLQMYALYKTVERMGNEPEVINYFNSYMKSQLHIAKIQKHSGWRRVLRVKAKQILHARQYAGFKRFEKPLTKFPKAPVSEKNGLPQIGERYDAVICGSDQVWNPDITNYDLSYFLDFCGCETRRVSYAPSFGVEEVSEEYGRRIGKELMKFSDLSVREESGQKLIGELTGRQAQLVVDPTLLLDSKDWEHCETAHPAAKGDYILYYTVRSSESLWKYCLNLAEKCNMKILRIGSNMISRHLKGSDKVTYVCDISPDEWLYLIHHARYIVTNSFHGTAFAINYRRDFFVEFSSLTNSRLSNIVKLLGLEGQVVKNERSELPMTTDYSCAEKILPEMKAESLRFLKRALTDASGEYETT